MKKILLCLILPVLLLAAYACSVKSADPPAANNLWTVTDGITLRLLQDSYPPDPDAMTVILENRSDSVMLYGKGWSFEKYEDGAWREMETIENYAFTSEGYTLYDNDKKTLEVWTGFLSEPMSEGLYRVTGCSLRVARDAQNLSYGMDYVDYPPYQLEFTISKAATAERYDIQEQQPAKWQLPDIEAWQWYTPWDGLSMFDAAGMTCWEFVQGENGLCAVLYRPAEEDWQRSPGELLLLDIFDRKTGKRYEVFTEPAVEPGSVMAYEAGFKADCGDLLYCFIDDDDAVYIEALR